MSVSFNATFLEDGKNIATFKESEDAHAKFGVTSTVGNVVPSDDLPLMDGEASPGVSNKYSRSDHVHPHDSEKQNAMQRIGNLELEEMLV